MNSYEGDTIQINPQEQGPCALVQDLLPLYLEGEVSAGSRDVIVEHLARCERCAGFLAGAQTVRSQLRREQAGRPVNFGGSLGGAFAATAAPAAAAGPWAVATANAQANSPLLVFFMGLGLIFMSGLGSIGTLMFIDAPNGPKIFGLALVALAFGLLLLLGKLRGPWTGRRLLLLLASCGLGGLATLGIYATRGGDPLGVLINFGIGSLALVGVWRAVLAAPAGIAAQAAPGAPAAGAPANVAQAARPFAMPLRPRHIVAIGVVVAMLIGGFLMMQTINLTINAPIFVVALLAMAAVLWLRDHR